MINIWLSTFSELTIEISRFARNDGKRRHWWEEVGGGGAPKNPQEQIKKGVLVPREKKK